jgi:hypothetical protein
MGVLTDQDGWPWTRGKRRKHRPKDLLAGISLDRQLLDLKTQCRSQVTDGAERTRCGEGVARRPEHRHLRDTPCKPVDEGGLADSSLAADKYHPSMAGCRLPPVLLELSQVSLALQQLHRDALLG